MTRKPKPSVNAWKKRHKPKVHKRNTAYAKACRRVQLDTAEALLACRVAARAIENGTLSFARAALAHAVALLESEEI